MAAPVRMNPPVAASTRLNHGAWRVAVLLGAWSFAGCSAPPCANDVVRGLPSPDGVNIAFVFYRRCDKAAGTSTHVSVINMRTSLHSGPGNVLIVGNEQPVKVTWLGPHTLSVANFNEPVQFRNARVDQVTVEFH